MTISSLTFEQKLGLAVEQVVREHMAACEAAAAIAVRDAFRRVTATSPAKRKPSKSPGTKPKTPAGPRASYRTSQEVAQMTERLYEEIVRQPGEGMRVLSEALGAPIRHLERPMVRLREDGRVQSVGQRRRMRYFPVGT